MGFSATVGSTFRELTFAVFAGPSGSEAETDCACFQDPQDLIGDNDGSKMWSDQKHLTLSGNDYVDLRVKQDGTSGTIPLDGVHLWVKKISD